MYKLNYSYKSVLIFMIISTSLFLAVTPDTACATVESSIKGVGSSLQKSAIGVAVAAFSLGGGGMMFGAQWGYRIAIGTIIGVCFVLGGPAIVSFFQSQIR